MKRHPLEPLKKAPGPTASAAEDAAPTTGPWKGRDELRPEDQPARGRQAVRLPMLVLGLSPLKIGF